MQAANAADFSISKFRFLRRLLLLHGRTDYHRVSLVILFSFFKNITLVLTLFYYNFFNGFSGRGMYEDWMYVNFNAFTFFPCLVLGVLDVDFETDTVRANPQLYVTSREQRNLNTVETAKAIAFSVLTSALVFLIPYTTYSYIDGSSTNSVWAFGTVTYACLLTGVGVRAFFLTNTWGSRVVLGHVASILLFASFMFIHGHFTSVSFSDPAPFFYKTGDHVVANMYFWIVVLLAFLSIFMIHLVYAFFFSTSRCTFKPRSQL